MGQKASKKKALEFQEDEEVIEGGGSELRFENYHFTINEQSSNKVNIEVIYTKNFKVFFVKDFQFTTSTNTDTLKVGILKSREKSIKLAAISSLTEDKSNQIY